MVNDLADIAGRAICRRLELVEVLTEADRRNTVARLRVMDGDRAGTTLIVKKTKDFEHADPDGDARVRFFGDALGLTFLTKISGADHAPACQAIDASQGLLVMDDLGGVDSLVQPLLEGTNDGARQVLLAFARRLGAMHAATAGRLEGWDALVAELKAPEVLLVDQVTERDSRILDRGLAGFAKHLIDLELPPLTREQLAEIDLVREVVRRPGPFTVLLHQDACPDNVAVGADRLRLIDFEFARPGHALIDGLYPQLPFPTCWCCNRIPEDLTDELIASYRTELAAAIPEAADQNTFDTAAAQITAYWLIASFEWVFSTVLEEPGTWGIASKRGRELSRLTNFVKIGERTGGLPKLTDLARTLLATLRARWPGDSPLPLYPAFR